MTIDANFPRNIWTFWYQGKNNVPPIVKKCVQQLYKLHDDWDIHYLDASSTHFLEVESMIPINVWKKMSLAHRSDVLRTYLLVRYGGVWIDPTVYCIKKLDDWLFEYIPSGLFMFSNPGRDRVISNWFIAALPKNKILEAQLSALQDYWSNNEFRNLGKKNKSLLEQFLNRILSQNVNLTKFWFHFIARKIVRIYPYMVYHYLFYYLVVKQKSLLFDWEQMPKVSARAAHILQEAGLSEDCNEYIKHEIENPNSPVFKLTWKMRITTIPDQSILAYLFQYYEKR